MSQGGLVEGGIALPAVASGVYGNMASCSLESMEQCQLSLWV